jgi:integrase/recombinase XerC
MISSNNSLVDKFLNHLVGQRGRSANTVRVYTDDLRPFFQFLQEKRLGFRDLDHHHVRDYLAWLATSGKASGNGYARVSIARKLVVLRSFYQFLEQDGEVLTTPIPKGRSFRVKVEQRLPVFLGKEEAIRLMEAPDGSTPLGLRDKAILEILYSCGLRLSELASLNLANVDLDSRDVRVTGKGSKDRMVILGKPATAALVNYLRESRPYLLSNGRPKSPWSMEGAFFLNRYGSRLSRRSIQKVVAHYAVRAATRPGVHPHTLRHTFATHLMDGGADLRVVQELLGHTSPTTTQVYTHVTQSQAWQVYLSSHPRAKLDHRDD